MTEREEDATIPITYVTLNCTPDVGENDCLIYTRVVPDGRDGPVIYARSLLPDEPDDGRPVLVRPSCGERLAFRPGAIRISFDDADRPSKPEPDGYRPITNTIWTWLRVRPVPSDHLLRYLLASARRLDGTHVLFAETTRFMNDLSGGFIALRGQFFQALSAAEILVVALGRSIDLLEGFERHFSVGIPLPMTIASRMESIRPLRNAFEHIDDRALGQVRGRSHYDALTVFDQQSFLRESKLTYAGHSLNIKEDVIQMLMEARQYLRDVTVQLTEDAIQLNSPIQFFGPSPDGAGTAG